MSHQKGIDIKELAQMNQCFDTVGWITNVHPACKKPVLLIPKDYLPEQWLGGYKGDLAGPGSRGKRPLKRRFW